jgi:hypothetical protein
MSERLKDTKTQNKMKLNKKTHAIIRHDTILTTNRLCESGCSRLATIVVSKKPWLSRPCTHNDLDRSFIRKMGHIICELEIYIRNTMVNRTGLVASAELFTKLCTFCKRAKQRSS